MMCEKSEGLLISQQKQIEDLRWVQFWLDIHSRPRSSLVILFPDCPSNVLYACVYNTDVCLYEWWKIIMHQ